MEKTNDGFDPQLEVLVRMLGITTPDLKIQATDLLRKALIVNPKSAINDSSFFGRLKKLLFKPVPRKEKPRQSLPCALTSPVTPTIARGDHCNIAVPPVTPTTARGEHSNKREAYWYDPFANGKYSIDYSEDFQEYEDTSVPAAPYREDIIIEGPYGAYNSRGQRYDEDGDIVRDSRVYMCEEALSNYSNGTPHITDTYDLYALVQNVELSHVPDAIHQLLSSGIYAPHNDLQPRKTIDCIQPPADQSTSACHILSPRAIDEPAAQESTPTFPSTSADVSKKRNLIAHYIRTISLPPLTEEGFLTSRQIRKTRIDRGKQEKARLRQLKVFLAALTY